MIGKIFGRLLVISEEETEKKSRYFLCRCECGVEKIIAMSALKAGLTTSCGCYQKERARIAKTKHSMSKTPTYNSWRSMKERCDNPKNSHYEYYGGRGITYDKSWIKFESFFEDMGKRPEGMTLDRIDVNGDYCKENCKWSTISEQNLNGGLRKDNKTGYKGISLTVTGSYRVTYKSKAIKVVKTLDEAIELRKLYEEGG